MLVRRMIEADIPAVVRHTAEYHSKTQVKKYQFDANKVRAVLTAHLTRLNTLQIVAVEGSEVIGGLCADICEFTFSRDLYAEDRMFYVRPQYRSFLVALTLVLEYEKWAKECGVLQIRLGTIAGVGEETYKAFAERLGYKHFGTILSKDG